MEFYAALAFSGKLSPLYSSGLADAALVVLKNLLHHEVGLILLPLTRDESRLGAIAFHRAQFLGMAPGGEANDAIGGLVEDTYATPDVQPLRERLK